MANNQPECYRGTCTFCRNGCNGLEILIVECTGGGGGGVQLLPFVSRIELIDPIKDLILFPHSSNATCAAVEKQH